MCSLPIRRLPIKTYTPTSISKLDIRGMVRSNRESFCIWRSGFGYPSITGVHASPSKTGKDSEKVVPGDCPCKLA